MSFDNLIKFFSRLPNNIEILLFGLGIGLVIGIVIVMRFSKKIETNKFYSTVVISTICILIIFIIGIIVLGWNNNKISDSDVLMTLATILGPIIGYAGAYQIFTIQRKSDNESKKEYALDMLYSLIDNTLEQTDVILFRIVATITVLIQCGVLKYFSEDEELRYRFEYLDLENDESGIFLFLWTLEEEHIFPQIGKLKTTFYNEVNNDVEVDGLIYDESWYEHLAYLDNESKKYRKDIISWINLIKNTEIYMEDEADIFEYIDILHSQEKYYGKHDVNPSNKNNKNFNIIKFIHIREEIINFMNLNPEYNGKYETYKQKVYDSIRSHG